MSQPPHAWGTPPAPRRRRTGLYVAVTAAAATGAFFAGGAIGQSQNDDTSASGCKAALQRNYDQVTAEIQAGGDPESKDMPIECVGVDDKTLKRYAGEIIDKEFGEVLDEAWSSPTAQP